jgi:hypothetical protein
MTTPPMLAHAPTCYPPKRPLCAASAPTVLVTVRFQGATYVLSNPSEGVDPCGRLVKVEE